VVLIDAKFNVEGDHIPRIEVGRQLVWEWAAEALGVGKEHPTFSVEEVYCVWFCKTLQHWKALYSTTIPDKRYYEVTYNGDRDEVYIDTYRKTHNINVNEVYR
jgi:hypothetical protein